MIPIVCVDDRFGMAFNKRRCSSDMAVLKDILGRTESVKQMKDANKETYTGSRDDVIARGYTPCKKCNP